MNLIALVIAALAAGAAAVKVDMPDAQTLTKRCDDEGFRHFCEKSKLDKRLGQQSIEVPEVVRTVDAALNKYIATMPNAATKAVFTMSRPRLLGKVFFLNSYPEARAELDNIMVREQQIEFIQSRGLDADATARLIAALDEKDEN